MREVKETVKRMEKKQDEQLSKLVEFLVSLIILRDSYLHLLYLCLIICFISFGRPTLPPKRHGRPLKSGTLVNRRVS